MCGSERFFWVEVVLVAGSNGVDDVLRRKVTPVGDDSLPSLEAIGVGLFAMVEGIERALIPWHASRRTEMAAGTP